MLAEAVDQVNGLQPPAGVAPRWQRFVGAVAVLRDLVATLDLSNPEANRRYAGELQALRPGLVDGGAALDDRGRADC